MAPRQTLSIAGIAIGLGWCLLGGVIGFDAVTMRVPPTYAKVGPHIFPIVVAAGLLVTGLLIAYTAIVPSRDDAGRRGEMRRQTGGQSPSSPQRLVLNALLLKTLGFIITALGLFVIVAFALGSRHYLRDVAIGAVLALVTYFGFTRGLGLQLPSGIFAGVF